MAEKKTVKKSIASDQARERVSWILSRASVMQNAKLQYSSRWEEWEKIWKMFEEERRGQDRWRANLPDTWTYATIKTAQSAFGESKIVPIFHRHEDDESTKSRDLTDLYLDNAEKGELDLELYFTRLDAFKLGTGFLKTVYVEDKRTVQEITKFNAESGEITYKEKEVKDFDDPKTIRVSPYLVLVDEMARFDMSTARDLIEVEVLGWEDAKRNYAHFLGGEDAWERIIPKAGGLKEMFAKTQAVTGQAVASSDDVRRDTTRTFRFFAPVELADDAVEILHYWNRVQDTYEIIANGEPLRVKTSRNPSPIPYISKQIPFTPIRYSPYSGDEFWAASIIEIMRSETRAIRLHREMMTDRQKISLFSPAFSDVNDEIDQKILELRPFSIIRTRGGVPKQFSIPGLTNADLSLVHDYQESVKRATGIDERVLGSSADRLRLTATEIGMLREASMRRLQEFLYLYKRALIREIKLKLKLFEQYYVSPVRREKGIKSDKAMRTIVAQAKRYKVKVSSNVYTLREVRPNFFEGDIDADIDVQSLLPITKTQLLTTWAQVIRDLAPFVQMGIVRIDMEKPITRYLAAMDVDIETLRPDSSGEAILMAEGEHKMLADKNTSKKFLEIVPEGTPDQFLTADHIKRHHELMRGDQDIEESELKNLLLHIAQDTEKLRAKIEQERQTMQSSAMNSALIGQVGGVKPMMEAPEMPNMTPGMEAVSESPRPQP